MQESEVEHVVFRVHEIIEEMVLGRHVVPLVPISLPSSEYGESGINGEVYFILVSVSIASGDVSNEVKIVEASYVSG